MYMLCSHICLLLLIVSNLSSAQRSGYNNYNERIITDWHTILSPNGVERDFRYTERSNDNNQLISVPGCPKSIDGYPWILYKTNQEYRCYLAGYPGPCQHGQVLYARSGSVCGVCRCECNLNAENSINVPTLPESQRYKMCNNGRQVYDKWDKSVCYNLNEQGPCLEGAVLSFVESRINAGAGNTLKCLQVCNFDDPNWEQKEQNGECVALGAGGGGGGAPGSILPNQCRGSEKYSKVLQKCVKRFRNTALILG